MIETSILDRLLDLPAHDRLALAERLWNSLITDPGGVTVPDWHLGIVSERLDDDDTDPGAVERWSDVRARIEGGR